MPPSKRGLKALRHPFPGEVIKHATPCVLSQPLGESLVGYQAYDRISNLHVVFWIYQQTRFTIHNGIGNPTGSAPNSR